MKMRELIIGVSGEHKCIIMSGSVSIADTAWEEFDTFKLEYLLEFALNEWITHIFSNNCVYRYR